jgi:hypothetical protein
MLHDLRDVIRGDVDRDPGASGDLLYADLPSGSAHRHVRS